MSSVIRGNWNVDKNFWTEFPELKVPEAFRELYSADKSRDHVNSSKEMWAIALVYDYESRYDNFPFEERVKLVEDDYLTKPNHFERHADRLQKVIDFYNKLQETSIYRMVAEFNENLDIARESIRGFMKSKQPALVKEGLLMQGSMDKQMNVYEKLVAQLEKKKLENDNVGGVANSFLEDIHEGKM